MVLGLNKKTKKNKTTPQLYQPGDLDEQPTSAVMPDEPAPAFTLPEGFVNVIDNETGEVVVEDTTESGITADEVSSQAAEYEPVDIAPAEPVADPNETVWIENVFGQRMKTKRKKVSKNDTIIDDPKAPGGALELVSFVNEFGQIMQARREMVDDPSQIIDDSAAAEDATNEGAVEVDETGNLTVSKKKKKTKVDYTGIYIIGGLSLGLFIIVGLAGN
jgi:hypothetical protein